MSGIDFVIVLLFVVYALSSGLRSRKKASENLEEYFLAGRSLNGWQAGASMAATQFASDTPLLVTGLIATAGIFSLWQMWIYALAFLFLGFVLAPCWRRAKILTDAELTEIRYGKKPAAFLRGTKAIYFGTIFNCTVLAWVFFAATRIAEPFLLWDQWLSPEIFQSIVGLVEWVGVPLTLDQLTAAGEVWIKSANNFISIFLIILLTLFYSTTGGLRAVVRTDMLQLALMLSATAIFAYVVVSKVGGLDGLHTSLSEMFSSGRMEHLSLQNLLAFDPFSATNATSAFMLAISLLWLIQINSDGTGYLAQRTMACRSDKDAKIAAIVFTYLQIFLRSLLWILIGLGLLVVFPPDPSLTLGLLKSDREASFVRGMAELLPTGIKGVMVTGMLAALASTVDTHLNWGSSYWTNDIYKRFICRAWLKTEPSQKKLVWVARLSNVLILMIALGIGTQLQSIQEAWQISLLLGSGVGAVLVLRWMWWKMNAWGEIFAIMASLIASPIVYFTVEDQGARLLIIASLSTLAAVMAVFWKVPEDNEKLVEFYKRVHPPGFWGPIARQVKTSHIEDGRSRLLRGLSATLVASVSVFSLLVGIGSWLVSAPSPYWWPHSGSWQFFLVFLGFTSIFVWYKLGFQDKSLNQAVPPLNSKKYNLSGPSNEIPGDAQL